MAALAPMPRASVRATVSASHFARMRERRANLRSVIKLMIVRRRRSDAATLSLSMSKLALRFRHSPRQESGTMKIQTPGGRVGTDQDGPAGVIRRRNSHVRSILRQRPAGGADQWAR